MLYFRNFSKSFHRGRCGISGRRSISVERIVQGSVRVMPVCLAMGEAAGLVAAHAIQFHEGDVHRVNTSHLRQRLREEGGYLPDLEADLARSGQHQHGVAAVMA